MPRSPGLDLAHEEEAQMLAVLQHAGNGYLVALGKLREDGKIDPATADKF
jgi:hypothetical protein